MTTYVYEDHPPIRESITDLSWSALTNELNDSHAWGITRADVATAAHVLDMLVCAAQDIGDADLGEVSYVFDLVKWLESVMRKLGRS